MKRQLVRQVSVFFFGMMLSASIASAAVTFDWAGIGNAGNSADTQTGYGSVGYEYSIATTEVTNAQYVEFLNAVAGVDTYGLYNGGNYNQISRTSGSGTSADPYVYSANAGWENRPVVYVSWYDTLRFANWLHNGQVTGLQDATTTEDGAYTFTGATTVSARNAGANYWLPSENEWYKAAYYDPNTTEYYDYATSSNTLPNNNAPENDTGNSANYYNNGYTIGNPYYTTEVGAYILSASPYGTYDQSGNVWEWNDAIVGSNRILRGSSWHANQSAEYLPATARNTTGAATIENSTVGFRIAGLFTEDEAEAIPEPMSIGLMLLSVGGLLIRRAKNA